MSAERCPVCDREACPTLRRFCHRDYCEDADPPQDFAACPGCAAEADCRAHAHDWRAEALALRAEVAEMSARSREADAARVALGAANGETLLRAAQRVAGDAKMGAIALRVKARLTVGAALAIGNVIEFQASWTDDLTWIQIKCGERWRMWRTRAGESWWSMWTTPLNLDGVDRARPARLVPLSLADLDPATRGEMP